MTDRILSIEGYNALDIYGTNDTRLDIIRNIFPRIKIIARGDYLKIIGEPEILEAFNEKFALLLTHYDRFGKLSEEDIIHIMASDAPEAYIRSKDNNNILVYGNNGMQIKALTQNQRLMSESVNNNDMIFAIGPAGTGKTYTAVALAVRALKNKEIRRIILTRPAVEAGENLGFLPGDLKEKLDPYLMPLYDALRDMIPHQKLNSYIEDGTIEIAPLAFMRGRTLDHAFAILDEAQNATESQLKMFLTRMGKYAKFIITGDITQIDLPRKTLSGLLNARKLLGDIDGIKFIELDQHDVVRHKLVTKIINAYEKYHESEQAKQ